MIISFEVTRTFGQTTLVFVLFGLLVFLSLFDCLHWNSHNGDLSGKFHPRLKNRPGEFGLKPKVLNSKI